MNLLKYSISDNYFLIYTQINNNNPKNSYFLSSTIDNKLNSDTIHLIEFNYPAITENNFKSNYYLFHGAPLCSWYYIVKNGLKVMSNGAAYGTGIYLSNDFNTSASYSQKGSNSNFNVIGVFEVLNESTTYYL